MLQKIATALVDYTVVLEPDENRPEWWAGAPSVVRTLEGVFRMWRYSHWMRVGNEMFVYFEAARPNGTNEIRLDRFPVDEIQALP